MQKILITGASGFIGSHLAAEAASRGMQVYAGIRTSSSTRFLKDIPCRLFTLNLSSPETLENQLKIHLEKEGGFDYVIHNAGLTQNKREKNFTAINFQLTKNLIDAFYASGNIPRKIVYTSSISAAGPAPPGGKLNEQSTDAPVTPYGISKKKAEAYLLQSSIPTVIFRVPPVYGPREANMLSLFRIVKLGLRPTLGLRTQYLSMIYISDLVNFFMQGLESREQNKVYFISDGENYPQTRIVKAIAHALNKKTLPLKMPLFPLRIIIGTLGIKSAITGKGNILNHQKYKEIAPRNWQIDASKAIRELGCTPQYSIETGVAATLAWYREQEWL